MKITEDETSGKRDMFVMFPHANQVLSYLHKEDDLP